MLTTNVEEVGSSKSRTGSNYEVDVDPESYKSRRTNAALAKMLSIEWLGQTVASVCWIVSMLIYGISSTGDWLQLAAASAWFLANVASLAGGGVD